MPPIIFILILLPVITFGFLVWAFLRGSKRVKIATGVIGVIIVALLFIPKCEPLDLSKDDYNGVTGEMQGKELLGWLEKNQVQGYTPRNWKKVNGQWSNCKSGASVVRELYGWFFTEVDPNNSKVLIQTR